MTSSQECPSPSIPGAWPSSSLTLCLWRQNSDCGGSHYLPSYQNQSEPHWYQTTAGDSRPILATFSTADETPTNTTADDDSSIFTVANTSFLSAYTSTTPDLSPSLVGFQDGTSSDLQQHYLHSDPQQSLGQRDVNKLLITDQILQSLPEIPDLSSLSSSREQLAISPESSVQYPLRQCPDEGPFEVQGNSFEANGPDVSSSSSIRFRAVRASSPFDPSETSPGPLRYLRIERNSRIPPPILSHRGPPFSGPTRTSPRLNLTGRMSEYTNTTWTNFRRSWGPGESLPDHHFQQEDLSVTVYANDLLDRAFDVDNRESCFVLEPFDICQDNTSAQSSNGHTLSRRAPPPTMIKGTRVRFLHAIGKKVRRLFMKLKTKGRETSNRDEFANPAPHIPRFWSNEAKGTRPRSDNRVYVISPFRSSR